MTFSKLDEELFHRGPAFAVSRARFLGPDGMMFERDIVRHPGAVSIVAINHDHEVAFVRQFRAPLRQIILEIPAGTCEVGEDPEVTANRELAEEIGMTARSMQLLGEFHNSPGYSDERSFVYLATRLTPCEATPIGPEEEAMEIITIPLEEIPDLIESRELVDAKSIIGVQLARSRYLTQFTRFCPYCGSRYELPPLRDARIQMTMDICPPARVGITAVPFGQRLPNFGVDPMVHYCEHGRRKPIPT